MTIDHFLWTHEAIRKLNEIADPEARKGVKKKVRSFESEKSRHQNLFSAGYVDYTGPVLGVGGLPLTMNIYITHRHGGDTAWVVSVAVW